MTHTNYIKQNKKQSTNCSGLYTDKCLCCKLITCMQELIITQVLTLDVSKEQFLPHLLASAPCP